MEPSLLFGAAGILGVAGILRLAADTYGERRSSTLLVFGLSMLCVALGLRAVAL
ncbi:MAG: hypothetical protein PVH68_06425 [Armatimonadota bacterium]|jgi:hypothetical protein